MQLSPTASRLSLAGLVLAAAATAWLARPGPEALAAPEPAPSARPQRPAPAAPAIALAVDASDLGRNLLRATATWPAAPGRLQLRFARWIQGTHAPCGAVANLAGLEVRDDRGTVLPWTRDPHDTHRFAVEVPSGAAAVAVSHVYIANQPTVNSQPVDVLAQDGVALINWNNALLHPEGWDDQALRVTASLRLPAGWSHACALPGEAAADGTIAFAATDLRTLLDAPVMAGRHLAVHRLHLPGFAPHRLAVAATRELGDPPARALAQLAAIGAEARELWGTAPFAQYTWLLALGGELPRFGLEHLASSANGLTQEGWWEGEDLDDDAAFLLSHEYGHVWIGKHHRPAGMLVGDHHTPLDTRLLWVYEGFDQWLGMILAARSGAVGRAAWFARLDRYLQNVAGNRSRTWRTLEDTANSSHLLRGGCQHWDELRGGQDYYLEGMLLCFEIDGMIRRATRGMRSFDDVVQRLFATRGVGTVNAFTEADVLAALAAAAPGEDWAGLIARRVRRTAPAYDFTTLAGWGMRAVWDEQRDPQHGEAGWFDERQSLGLLVYHGRVRAVVPGSPADLARLAEDCQILRVGGQPFGQGTWEAALRQRPADGRLRLGVRRPGGGEADAVLVWTRPRYLRFEPSDVPAERAILEAILAPRSPEGRAQRVAGGW